MIAIHMLIMFLLGLFHGYMIVYTGQLRRFARWRESRATRLYLGRRWHSRTGYDRRHGSRLDGMERRTAEGKVINT